LRKQVLVSVDRAETRVALLEATGEVAAKGNGRRRKPASQTAGYRVAELYVERRGKLWVGNAPLCEVDSFEGGRTATLRWVSEDVRLFEEVSRMLRAALATQASALGPSVGTLAIASDGNTTIARTAK